MQPKMTLLLNLNAVFSLVLATSFLSMGSVEARSNSRVPGTSSPTSACGGTPASFDQTAFEDHAQDLERLAKGEDIAGASEPQNRQECMASCDREWVAEQQRLFEESLAGGRACIDAMNDRIRSFLLSNPTPAACEGKVGEDLRFCLIDECQAGRGYESLCSVVQSASDEQWACLQQVTERHMLGLDAARKRWEQCLGDCRRSAPVRLLPNDIDVIAGIFKGLGFDNSEFEKYLQNLKAPQVCTFKASGTNFLGAN